MQRFEESGVVSRAEILSEDYIPAVISRRDAQVEEIRDCLNSLIRRARPRHMVLFGRPGTGKTTVAKYLADKLREEVGTRHLYINCWRKTSNAILWELLHKLGIACPENAGWGYKLTLLEKHLGDRQLLIILDELDGIPLRDRNDLLYELCIGQILLEVISYGPDILASVDGRTRSRFNPHAVHFNTYSADDLFCILEQRAELALVPEAWNVPLLKRIAELASGNARSALQILSNAAYYAEREGSCEIKAKHVEKGFGSLIGLKKSSAESSLNYHQKIIYTIAKEKGLVLSDELRKEYQQRCQALGLRAMAERTLTKYSSDLAIKGLVYKERHGKQYAIRPRS